MSKNVNTDSKEMTMEELELITTPETEVKPKRKFWPFKKKEEGKSEVVEEQPEESKPKKILKKVGLVAAGVGVGIAGTVLAAVKLSKSDEDEYEYVDNDEYETIVEMENEEE